MVQHTNIKQLGDLVVLRLSYGNIMLRMNSPALYRVALKVIHTSFVCANTERRTDTMSVFLVKDPVDIPRSPLSCWREMVMAAPAINPMIAACER